MFHQEASVETIKLTVKETDYKVQGNGNISEKFKISKGLKQGDPLSTTLFNIVLDKTIKDTKLPTNRTLYNQVYADDIVILTRNKGNVIEAIMKLVRATKDQGVEINEFKTKYVVLNEQQKRQDANLAVSAENGKHYNFERVNVTLNYLSVTLTDSNKEEIEILERITNGTKCVGDFGALDTKSQKRIKKDETKVSIKRQDQ